MARDGTKYIQGAPDSEKIVSRWRERIKQAREARRAYEPAWLSNMAFSAGKQWLKWNRTSRQLEMPPDLERKELYTADFITEYRMAALGEMSSSELLPELLLVENEHWSEEYAAAANRALRYAWENEWNAEEAITEARRIVVDVSTSAIRVRFDPLAGPVRAKSVPFREGKPILDEEEARRYVAETAARGGRADLRDIHEGVIRFEVLSPFNLLPPPGVPNEHDFPWEVVVRPVPLDDVKFMYGEAADSLVEDGNIGSLFGFEASDAPESQSFRGLQDDRLRNHVWIYTCYERPNPRHPRGQVVILGGQQMNLLSVRDELPCVGPDGEYRSGITYFHWWRVSGRFWSRSLVEALKDPQRLLNRRKTQNAEIVDRGMPMLLVREGSLKQKPRGLPMETIEVRGDSPLPQVTTGSGPGQWMYEEIQQLRDDLERTSTIKAVRLGENPSYVTTYSQLAVLNENDQGKREPIYEQHRQAIRELVECGVYYIRTYWGPQKQILLAPEGEGRVQAELFDATKLPPFYIVRVATGVAKPRSQAAELKKIEDVALYAARTGQALPVQWYAKSLDAGEIQELPESPPDSHLYKSLLENHMIAQGAPVQVAYYDPIEVHVPVHRTAQIQAELAGDMQLWQRFEDHILEHQAVTAQNTQVIAEIAPPDLGPEEGMGEAGAFSAPAGGVGRGTGNVEPAPPVAPGSF